jgi:carboxylesterase type B
MHTTVTTGYGAVRGSVRDGIARFLGIPYAAAPTGSLRYRAPAPRQSWDGVRDALEFGPAAPQHRPDGIPPWPAYRPGDRAMLEFSQAHRVVRDPDPETLALWPTDHAHVS